MAKNDASRGRNFERWSDLFDPSYMGLCCDQIYEEIAATQLDCWGTFQVALRSQLLLQLDAYIEDHWRSAQDDRHDHMRAARALHDLVDDLACKFEERFPFSGDCAVNRSSAIRQCWICFRADGSSSRIYNDLPAEKKRRARPGPRGKGKLISAKDVATQVAAAAPGTLAKVAAHSLHEKTGVSLRTVQRRKREAKDNGLMP